MLLMGFMSFHRILIPSNKYATALELHMHKLPDLMKWKQSISLNKTRHGCKELRTMMRWDGVWFDGISAIIIIQFAFRRNLHFLFIFILVPWDILVRIILMNNPSILPCQGILGQSIPEVYIVTGKTETVYKMDLKGWWSRRGSWLPIINKWFKFHHAKRNSSQTQFAFVVELGLVWF